MARLVRAFSLEATMKRIARFIRKLADLADPTVSPSDKLTIVVNVETSGAIAEIDRLRKAIESIPEIKINPKK